MIPDNLLYTEQHEWVKRDGSAVTVGITDHAQQQLGDMTFVELPEVGATLKQGDEALSVESAKAAAGVYAPADGEVTEVNESLEEDPGKVNAEPYDGGWMYKMSLTSPDQLSTLMDKAAYETFLQEQT